MYFRDIVDLSDARRLRHNRRAKTILERLARETPTAISIQAEWASSLCNDANQPRSDATRGEIEEWLREDELSIATLRGVVAADPDLLRPLADLGKALFDYGYQIIAVGRHEEGMAYRKEAYDLLEPSDFTRSSFSFREGHLHKLQARVFHATGLAMNGRPVEALVGLEENKVGNS